MARIHVQGTEVDITSYPGETVLDALKRTGNAIRVGCRRGGCAICKVEVVEGSYEYTRPIADKVLTDEEVERGTCLTCRAVPTSDLVVSLAGHHERVDTLMAFFTRNLKETSSAT
ncbi:MAG: 2Fe-2S iron-sulfur cluster-binding protein [Candidatus Nanopelagicales bacterium]